MFVISGKDGLKGKITRPLIIGHNDTPTGCGRARLNNYQKELKKCLKFKAKSKNHEIQITMTMSVAVSK